MKKLELFTVSISIILVFLLLLSGCSSEKSAAEDTQSVIYEERIHLTLCLDTETYSHNNRYLTDIIADFEDTHPNVEIKLTELTEDDLAADKHADIYLLNTGTGSYIIDREIRDPLFPDVGQAMRAGFFADIGEFYDDDWEFTSGLNQAVMNAGLVKGKRYTLPLRFDYPIVVVNAEAFQQKLLDVGIFNEDINTVLNEITGSSDPALARASGFKLQFHLLSLFPDFIDYDTGDILVSHAEVKAFLDSWYPYRDLMRTSGTVDLDEDLATFMNYAKYEQTWIQHGEAMEFCSLSYAIPSAAFAKAEDIDAEMFPVTGMDNQIVAEVIQFGAVGAECKNPELAYEFLRSFLTKEIQWDKDNESLLDSINDYKLFPGYSVRTSGSAAIYYQNLYQCASAQSYMRVENENTDTPVNRLSQVELTDDDVPIVDAEIDIVRYPAPQLESDLFRLIDNAENTDTNFIASEFISIVEAYLKK